MLFKLFLVFTIVPLAELAILIWIGKETEVWVPIALVILTGLAGAALMRWQGRRTLRRIREELEIGNMPADALIDGLFVFAGGVMLVTPGVLTDLIGISLLLPFTRKLYRRWIRGWFLRKIQSGQVQVSSSIRIYGPPDQN